MTDFNLTGRKALVTGGARGLGAGMAVALAEAGAAVMIGDVLEAQGRDTAAARSDGQDQCTQAEQCQGRGFGHRRGDSHKSEFGQADTAAS